MHHSLFSLFLFLDMTRTMMYSPSCARALVRIELNLTIRSFCMSIRRFKNTGRGYSKGGQCCGQRCRVRTVTQRHLYKAQRDRRAKVTMHGNTIRSHRQKATTIQSQSPEQSQQQQSCTEVDQPTEANSRTMSPTEGSTHPGSPE